MGGIRPTSAKIIFHVFAVLLFLLGSGIIDTEMTKWSSILILFATAVILTTEGGIKKFADDSRTAGELISGGLILVMIGAGIWRFVAGDIPGFLTTLNSYIVSVAAIWIVVEAWF